MIGTVVGGKYRVERALGEGGMGAVWVAVQEPLGRRVALKVIRGALDSTARARFEREAKIVAALRCPHVVTLFDFGEHEGAPYIVLEMLDGETLRDRLDRGPLAADEALSIARDIACGLRSAHEMGVIHRDLKPENVFLVPDKDRGWFAKLLDFGIAKPLGAVPDGATAAGTVAGTIGYMAPEVVLHGASSDPRVDFYALGVILFEMIAGVPPFTAATPLSIVAAHATEPAPDVRARRPDASAALASLVDRLLQKDPARRPASSDALIAEIDALRAVGLPTTAALRPLERALGSGALGLPERPSIAVQPFSAIGGSDEDAILAEGVSEEIRTALSRFKNLFVVSIATMIEPGGRDTDPIRVGHTLGVRYVVQGNVRRSAERVRVSAKLIDTQSGGQLWANRYDAARCDVFELEDDITQSIVSSVAGQVEMAQAERARKMPPHTLAAHDWLARGRYYHHRRTFEDNQRSREALDRAVEIDPEFAPAHAWRACAYGQGLGMGLKPQEQAHATLMDSLQRALALDEADSECHRLACEIAFMKGDLVRAEHHHKRAIALNPNDARIVGQAGELLMYTGDLEQAATLMTRAARLDPLSPTPYLRLLVRVRYVQGELDEAWRLFRCVDDHFPPFVALGAAIAAMRGEDFSGLVAEVRANVSDRRMIAWTPPFVDPARRERWRRGFELAGLVES